MTLPELRKLVDNHWARGEFRLAAVAITHFPIMDGKAGPAQFWIDWAHDVLSGKIKPEIAKKPDIPPWKDGDLFGEPLTTGRRRRGR